MWPGTVFQGRGKFWKEFYFKEMELELNYWNLIEWNSASLKKMHEWMVSEL